MSEPASYDATNIKVLKGLDAVRKRPGMYIGDRRRHQWNDSYQENICCFTNNLSAELRKSG